MGIFFPFLCFLSFQLIPIILVKINLLFFANIIFQFPHLKINKNMKNLNFFIFSHFSDTNFSFFFFYFNSLFLIPSGYILILYFFSSSFFIYIFYGSNTYHLIFSFPLYLFMSFILISFFILFLFPTRNRTTLKNIIYQAIQKCRTRQWLFHKNQRTNPQFYTNTNILFYLLNNKTNNKWLFHQILFLLCWCCMLWEWFNQRHKNFI